MPSVDALEPTQAPAVTPIPPRSHTPQQDRRRARVVRWLQLGWTLPALAFYGIFALYPVAQGFRYSFYDFDGITRATFVGLDNYRRVLTEPHLFGSIIHSFILLLFYAVIPIMIGLLSAAVLRDLPPGRFSAFARVLIFVPQVMPLVGAAVVWKWMYSSEGPINAFLELIGRDDLSRAWLADFTWALPAVGIIGSWLSAGFATIFFLAGLGRIPSELYDAAKIDGAGAIREFTTVTLPGLRHEMLVVSTLSAISALSTFDVINVATNGGPGYSTMVPAVLVVRLAFTENQVGLGSALGIILMVVVLAIIVPMQRTLRAAR